jgi:outer membrane protein, heavy metal efflux system
LILKRITRAAFMLALSASAAGAAASCHAQSKGVSKPQRANRAAQSDEDSDRATQDSEKPSSRRGAGIRLVAAQENEPAPAAPGLDLASLKSIALECSPTLLEASAHIDSLIGKRTQAGLWPNPEVGFSGQQIGSRGLAEQNGVMMGQKIITAQKLRTDQAVISEEIRRAQYFYDAQRLRLETDVSIAFYEALAAQKLLEQTEELTRIADEAHKTLEKLRLGSEASRIDVLQAKLELDSTRILRENAQHRVASAWKNLVTIIGQPHLAPQPLSGKLQQGVLHYLWDDALAMLMEQSPELRQAQATAERARWAHQRAMREVYPNIDAMGIVQKDHQIQGWDGAIQVSLPVPIINRNQGQIREMLANIAVAEQAVQRTRLQLENRLAKVFERYENAQKQVELYEKELLPTATEQLQLTTRVFRAGEVGYINLLTAQRSFNQVHINALDAQRELAVASARIEGLLLEGSLEDPKLAP